MPTHQRAAPFRLIMVLSLLTLVASVQAQGTSRKVKEVRVPPVAVDSTPLNEAELAVAAGVYVGHLPCELGQSVTLTPDPSAPGYFHLQFKDQRYRVRPFQTSTGAVRLEDKAQGAVWIQLANKSMLMNQKLGQRLTDNCASPVQQAVAESMKTNPAPNLLDVAQKPR